VKRPLKNPTALLESRFSRIVSGTFWKTYTRDRFTPTSFLLPPAFPTTVHDDHVIRDESYATVVESLLELVGSIVDTEVRFVGIPIWRLNVD